MFELILPHLPPGLQKALLSPEYREVCVNEGGRVFVEAAGSNIMRELAGIAPAQTPGLSKLGLQKIGGSLLG